MANDILKGQWKQMRGQVRNWWGKLTDNDLDRIEGNKEKLVGMLQEKYGYTHAQAEQQVDQRMREYDQQHGRTSTGRGTQPPSTHA